MIASWEGEENSWFKQIFSKKESRLGSAEVVKKSFRLPDSSQPFTERSRYDQKDYPVEIIEDPDRKKKISKGALSDLLNSR